MLRARTILVVLLGMLSIGGIVGCGAGSDTGLTGTDLPTNINVPSTTGGIPSPPVFGPLPSPVPLITPSPSPAAQ